MPGLVNNVMKFSFWRLLPNLKGIINLKAFHSLTPYSPHLQLTRHPVETMDDISTPAKRQAIQLKKRSDVLRRFGLGMGNQKFVDVYFTADAHEVFCFCKHHVHHGKAICACTLPCYSSQSQSDTVTDSPSAVTEHWGEDGTDVGTGNMPVVGRKYTLHKYDHTYFEGDINRPVIVLIPTEIDIEGTPKETLKRPRYPWISRDTVSAIHIGGLLNEGYNITVTVTDIFKYSEPGDAVEKSLFIVSWRSDDPYETD